MKVRENESGRSPIWFGIIGGFLAGINNLIAVIALGVFQGPIVAFTTPFAFCLGRLLYPSLPAATLIYLPVVIVSIFTVNLGPPGHYKITFLLGAIFYDIICYMFGVGIKKQDKIPIWKLFPGNIAYPIGLLLGAVIAISWVSVELPILSRSWTGAIIFSVVFCLIGFFATWVCHRIFYKYIHDEISM